MKTIILKTILAALLLIYLTAAYSQNSSREGGENASSALVIASLPFYDNGNTSDNLHDHAGCWPSSDAQDVVYSYTPVIDEWITASLCGSAFDTRMFAAKNDISNVIERGDDECWDMASKLACFDVHPGNTYYIVVTGWPGEMGEYVIEVTSCGTIIPLECPPCAIPEGEADIAETCTSSGVDVTNGGCGSIPPLFLDINIGDIYCGRCNVYNNGAYWDTDHYRIVLTETKTLYWSVYSNFNMEINIIKNDCSPILQWGYGNKTFVSVSATLEPGTYNFRVKPAELMFGANEGDYIATLTEAPVSPDPEDWCPAMPVSVPMRAWAVGIAIIMMLFLVSFRFFRK